MTSDREARENNLLSIEYFDDKDYDVCNHLNLLFANEDSLDKIDRILAELKVLLKSTSDELCNTIYANSSKRKKYKTILFRRFDAHHNGRFINYM